MQLLDSYATRYSEMLDGRSEHMPVSELAGGARIRHIFQDIFSKGLDELNPSRWAHMNAATMSSLVSSSLFCAFTLGFASLLCLCHVCTHDQVAEPQSQPRQAP